MESLVGRPAAVVLVERVAATALVRVEGLAAVVGLVKTELIQDNFSWLGAEKKAVVLVGTITGKVAFVEGRIDAAEPEVTVWLSIGEWVPQQGNQASGNSLEPLRR